MATTKQKLYKNITILSFITFFLSFAIAIACLCWQKYSIAIYFLCSSIACIIVSFFTLLRSPLTSSKLTANGSEGQRHTTKINWFVYNKNEFFPISKFALIRLYIYKTLTLVSAILVIVGIIIGNITLWYSSAFACGISFVLRRVNQQVQNYKTCLKNSRFGIEKFNFSLGLSFNFFCIDIILLSV